MGRDASAQQTAKLGDANCYVCICGLKGMERGVDEAFRDACRTHDMDWDLLRPTLPE